MKSKGQASYNVCPGDVEEVVPTVLVSCRASLLAFKLSYHSTQEMYSPVGSKNLRMTCSGLQSTGAEMRKYLTVGPGLVGWIE
jgi:hypothetical protein